MDGFNLYSERYCRTSRKTHFINSKITDKRSIFVWDHMQESFIHCIQAWFCGLWQHSYILLISPVRVLNKQEEIRGEGRGREGRACLLARTSLASHPLASCQLCCPSPSLRPRRQTGCQCRGGQHAPQNKHTHCQFLLSLYLSICRLSVSQA